MKKIAVTGSNGLIGSRFISLLKNGFNLFGLSRSNGFDVTYIDSIPKVIDEINPEVIIHFAAKTDVDSCEKDKISDTDKLNKREILNNGEIKIQNINCEDWKNDRGAFSVNVAGTKNLADYCLGKKITIVYVSTDFVFAGNKDYYNEEDVPDPVNWYGQTKYWGEEIVSELLDNYIIARLSYPYGFKSQIKKDFVWKIYDLLENGKEIFLVEDQIITPTFIDDIVFGLKYLIDEQASGLYHLVGDSFLSPYSVGKIVASEFLIKNTQIKSIGREEFYKDRARRGFKYRLKNDKLEKLGFKTKTFEEGISIIKKSL